jgi:hypothetical protein
MSLTTLYSEKKTALAPPKNQETYTEFVFDMEKNGTNDLVERNMIDPTFRPPSVTDTYLARVFAEDKN